MSASVLQSLQHVKFISLICLVSMILIQPCTSWTSGVTSHCLSTATTSSASGCFVGRSISTRSRTTTTRKTTTTTTLPPLSMVFERMSEDCIVSLVTAQKEARKLGLKEVTNEVMLAGIVDRPEKAKTTLTQYGITWRRVLVTLKEMYSNSNNDSSSFSFFKTQTTAAEDLPFSRSLKTSMVAASKLADQMASKTVHSHHVLLALLEFDGTTAAKPEHERISCGALAVIINSDGVNENFDALDFCNTLVAFLEQDAKEEQQLVMAGSASSSGKTPTLSECGVDLTQQARAGQLDPVYGRDDEIRSCLRTLVRRRKNNPCLIGGTFSDCSSFVYDRNVLD